jgi:hypothetical protein
MAFGGSFIVGSFFGNGVGLGKLHGYAGCYRQGGDYRLVSYGDRIALLLSAIWGFTGFFWAWQL